MQHILEEAWYNRYIFGIRLLKRKFKSPGVLTNGWNKMWYFTELDI